MIKDFDDVDVSSLSADKRKSYADDIIADFRDKVFPSASGRVKSPRVDAPDWITTDSSVESKRLKLRRRHIDKKLEGLPDWFKERKSGYKADLSPTLPLQRDRKILQKVAAFENKAVYITLHHQEVSEPIHPSFCDVTTGRVELYFSNRDAESYKKLVALHEAAHITLTPDPTGLPEHDQKFVSDNRFLVNVVEDFRMNRYICLKYNGMTRYFKETAKRDEQEICRLAIGDLIDDKSDKYNKFDIKNPFGRALQKHLEEIRACASYDDVLTVARKIAKDRCKKDKKQSDDKKVCGCSGGSGIGKSLKKKLCPEGDCYTQDDMKKYISESDVRLFGSTDVIDPNIERLYDQEEYDDLEKIKFSPQKFLSSTSNNCHVVRLNKSLLRRLKKTGGTKKTKEGRLDKIDPVRMITDSNIFHRKKVTKEVPHIYMILDCSGSMWQDSLDWESSLSMSIAKLCEAVNVPYKCFAHSGEKREFWYAELQKKHLPYITSKHYNLDGSMLETLLDNIIPKNEKAIVFYFSDGGLPAEYGKHEKRKLITQLDRADSRRIPIFGIGLNNSEVEGVFKKWYVVESPDELPGAMNDIGRFLKKYL